MVPRLLVAIVLVGFAVSESSVVLSLIAMLLLFVMWLCNRAAYRADPILSAIGLPLTLSIVGVRHGCFRALVQ
jgi:hypothetical protein